MTSLKRFKAVCLTLLILLSAIHAVAQRNVPKWTPLPECPTFGTPGVGAGIRRDQLVEIIRERLGRDTTWSAPQQRPVERFTFTEPSPVYKWNRVPLDFGPKVEYRPSLLNFDSPTLTTLTGQPLTVILTAPEQPVTLKRFRNR